MIDRKLALAFLNERLWSDEQGAYAEATTIPIYHQNDNTLARLVMMRHYPKRAEILKEGLLKDYIDPRWCILYGDATNFRPVADVLPDYMRYADLVALNYIHQQVDPAFPGLSPNYSFGIINLSC